MNIERDLYPLLIAEWGALDLGAPPDRLSSMLIKGNRKSVFCIFSNGRSSPSAIVKFALQKDDWHRLQNEKATIDALLECLPELAAQFLSPCILREVGNGLALIRRSAPGRPLSVGIRPANAAGQPTMNFDLVAKAFSALLILQRRMGHRISQTVSPQDAVVVLSREHPLFKLAQETRPASKNVLSAISDGRLKSTVEHGDFNPDNLFGNRGHITIIDWEWGSIPGLPLVDYYEFALQTCKASSIQGMARSRPIEPGDALTAFGRNAFADRIRTWIDRASLELGVSPELQTDLLTLHLSRYFSELDLHLVLRELDLKTGNRD